MYANLNLMFIKPTSEDIDQKDKYWMMISDVNKHVFFMLCIIIFDVITPQDIS